MSLAQELENQIKETKKAIDSALEPVKDLKRLVVRAEGLGSTLEQGVDHLEDIAEGFEVGITAFSRCADDLKSLIEGISKSDPQKVYEELTLLNENLDRFKENQSQKMAELQDAAVNIRGGQQEIVQELKKNQETVANLINIALDKNIESSLMIDEKISRLARGQEDFAKDLEEKLSQSSRWKTTTIIINLVGFAVIAAIMVLR